MHTILIAEDELLIAEGIKSLLEATTEFEVLGIALNGNDAIELYKKTHPDLVLMDVKMPRLNGVESTYAITKFDENAKVIGMSSDCDYDSVHEMIIAGACGYITKTISFHELLIAIKAIVDNKRYLSAEAASILISDITQNKDIYHNINNQYNISSLSRREREILQLIVEKSTSKQVADVLNISEKTVLTHRQNIMKKLGCHSIIDLVKFSIQQKIATL